MQRFFLTCAISLGLLAAHLLYAQLVNPMTRTVDQPRRTRPAALAAQRSNASSQAAESWLPDEGWIKTAEKRWQRSEHSFMYSQTMEVVEQTNSEAGVATQGDAIRMKPFAMIWKDPKRPDDPPLTVVAESARVRFENQFLDDDTLEENSISLTNKDAGRIVSAALEGKVRVTGPDGLVFEGEDFNFNEQTAQLYSDLPVNFRYGPARTGQPVQVRGTSASGFLVELTHDPNSSMGKDMPSVAEMPKFARLSGRVVIDLISESRGQPSKTRVTSEGPCQYDFTQNILSFRENVLVSRPQGQSFKDEIECYLLALIFGDITAPHDSKADQILQVRSEGAVSPIPSESIPSEPTSPGLISRMELKSIRASANQVTRERGIFRSTANGVECEFEDMQYDAAMRLLTLTDPERVNVWREVKGQLQKFEAPKIEIRHSADQKLDQLSGVGAGQFIHRVDSVSEGSPDLLALWKDRLDLVPNRQDRWTELTIRGNASVRQLDQMEFTGQTLKAWMPLLDELDMSALETGPKKPTGTQKFDPDQVPIRRMQAIGNVSFFVSGVIGRRIDQVDIQVDPGQIIPLQRPEPGARSDADSSNPLQDGEPIVFECARIVGKAVFDTATKQSDIRELHGFEGVQLFRLAPGTETDSGSQNLAFEQQPIRVTAREFSATNEGGTRQVLTLRGVVDDQGKIREPVMGRFGDFSLEGPKIIIDREKNLVTIPGQGVLRFPVDRDFSGHPLKSPVIATIACLERITFDGQRATFLESVKATLLDNQVKAEQMIAVLSGRIDFSADRPDTSGLAIQAMECEDKVSVEMYQYDPRGELIEILKASLNQFESNVDTGEFHGKGPGKIEDWRRTGTRRMLVQSHDSAQSNRPADSHRDFPWEYVVIDFKGPLEGNMQKRWGKLKDEAQLLYAPVKNAYLTFKHNDLSGDGENAGNAVWVGSEQMTVVMTGDGTPGNPQSASLVAQGNAEIEGRNFYARAYSLEYEQAQEMFTLKGKGQDKATLNVQRRPGEPFSKLPAQTIRIFPSKQEVSVDGAETFTTTFGGQ